MKTFAEMTKALHEIHTEKFAYKNHPLKPFIY